MQELGKPSPTVYKLITDLVTDINRVSEHPDIEDYLMNVREGDVFEIKEKDLTLKLTVVETPGHIKDHLCFLLEQKGEETILFTGDHIIGAPTVSKGIIIYFVDNLL